MATDDELFARLKKLDEAMTPHPPMDPVMRLPRGKEVKLSPDEVKDLGLWPYPVERCKGRGHIISGSLNGPYGIPYAGPEMIFCARPTGHTGDHYSRPIKGSLWGWRRERATSEGGGWCFHWPLRRLPPAEGS